MVYSDIFLGGNDFWLATIGIFGHYLVYCMKEVPLVVNQKEAIGLLSSRAVVRRLEREGWLKPCLRRGRLCLYLRADILACAARMAMGEYPSSP